jgi:hypothetical protein
MEDNKKTNSEPTPENIRENANYHPANRDFQRTEEDVDNVSKSEEEELRKRKQRTHQASTTPDKNHIG